MCVLPALLCIYYINHILPPTVIRTPKFTPIPYTHYVLVGPPATATPSHIRPILPHPPPYTHHVPVGLEPDFDLLFLLLAHVRVEGTTAADANARDGVEQTVDDERAQCLR